MIYREDDVRNLINTLDIVEVIGKRVELKKAGSNYMGLCPFHGEKTPSFSVSPSKNMFKCFGCGESGGVIEFYKKINNLDFKEAVEELSKEYNLPLRTTGNARAAREQKNEYEKYYRIMEEAADYFLKNIFEPRAADALKYLNGRGLSDEFIKQNRIGYSYDSWDSLLNYMTEHGHSREELLTLGLIKKTDKDSCYDVFRDRVIFPIYSYEGRIIGFGGRIMSDSKEIAKYLNSPETPIFNKGKNLYGLIKKGESIRKKNYAMLVEGYMDVISAHLSEFDNAVASLGTSLTDDQAKLLKKFTSNIIIAYDMDDAGRKAAERASMILKKHEFNIRILELNGAKDPDEFLKKFGKEEFIERIKQSPEVFDYLYKYYSTGVNTSDIMGKRIIAEKFEEFMRSLKNNMEENFYMDKLAANIGIERRAIAETFRKHEKKQEKKSYTKRHVFDRLELETMKLIISDRKSYQRIKESLGGLVFEDRILSRLFECIEKNIDTDDLESAVMNEFDFYDDEERELVANIIFDIAEFSKDADTTEEIIEAWVRKSRMLQLEEIKKRMATAGIGENEKKRLAYLYLDIQKSLKNN